MTRRFAPPPPFAFGDIVVLLDVADRVEMLAEADKVLTETEAKQRERQQAAHAR